MTSVSLICALCKLFSLSGMIKRVDVIVNGTWRIWFVSDFFFCCSRNMSWYWVKKIDTMGGMSYLRRDDWAVRQKFLKDTFWCQSGFWDRKEKECFSEFDRHVEVISLMKFECLGSRLLFSTGKKCVQFLSITFGRNIQAFVFLVSVPATCSRLLW